MEHKTYIALTRIGIEVSLDGTIYSNLRQLGKDYEDGKLTEQQKVDGCNLLDVFNGLSKNLEGITLGRLSFPE